MNSRIRAAYAGVIIVSALTAPLAAGQVEQVQKPAKHRTAVKLSSRFPAFSGRVTSGFHRCASHRRVELFRKGNGGEPKRLGADRSSSSGSWAVPVDNVKSGAYYALAKPKRLGGSHRKSICRSGRSKVVVVD